MLFQCWRYFTDSRLAEPDGSKLLPKIFAIAGKPNSIVLLNFEAQSLGNDQRLNTELYCLRLLLGAFAKMNGLSFLHDVVEQDSTMTIR
ncbi:MAG: hypothetical protein ACK56W_24825 [Pirellula sp.]|nr:hypothetical protein [Pirellula sp.]